MWYDVFSMEDGEITVSQTPKAQQVETERRDAGARFHSRLFGQRFENTPTISEMPIAFNGPRELSSVCWQILNNPGIYENEFYSQGALLENGRFLFSEVRKGGESSVGFLCRLSSFLELNLRGIQENLKNRKGLSINPNTLTVHNHPVNCDKDHCSLSYGDFRALLSFSKYTNVVIVDHIELNGVTRSRITLFVKGKEARESKSRRVYSESGDTSKYPWAQLEEMIDGQKAHELAIALKLGAIRSVTLAGKQVIIADNVSVKNSKLIAAILAANGIATYESILDKEEEQNSGLPFHLVRGPKMDSGLMSRGQVALPLKFILNR